MIDRCTVANKPSTEVQWIIALGLGSLGLTGSAYLLPITWAWLIVAAFAMLLCSLLMICIWWWRPKVHGFVRRRPKAFLLGGVTGIVMTVVEFYLVLLAAS